MTDWQAWAPPLNPPTAGGLDLADAERIAALYWADEPHLCAALQWESYAATLPPGSAVSQVQTGMQSVTYSPAMPGGDYGQAISRAIWHRSFVGSLVTVPLDLAPLDLPDEPRWWETDPVTSGNGAVGQAGAPEGGAPC